MITRDVHDIHSRCIQAGWASQAWSACLRGGSDQVSQSFRKELQHNSLGLMAQE